MSGDLNSRHNHMGDPTGANNCCTSTRTPLSHVTVSCMLRVGAVTRGHGLVHTKDSLFQAFRYAFFRPPSPVCAFPHYLNAWDRLHEEQPRGIFPTSEVVESDLQSYRAGRFVVENKLDYCGRGISRYFFFSFYLWIKALHLVFP